MLAGVGVAIAGFYGTASDSLTKRHLGNVALGLTKVNSGFMSCHSLSIGHFIHWGCMIFLQLWQDPDDFSVSGNSFEYLKLQECLMDHGIIFVIPMKGNRKVNT